MLQCDFYDFALSDKIQKVTKVLVFVTKCQNGNWVWKYSRSNVKTYCIMLRMLI